MKFLSSSPSSAASTTTTATSAASFDGGRICDLRSATAGCLAGIFRRFLCFDQIKDAELNSVELDRFGCLGTEEAVEAAVNPGIVARLMGLESMPKIDFCNSQRACNSIARRTRSMNFDSWTEKGTMQGQHWRRAKTTSMSFREPPTFLEHEEFFVLSFEEFGSKEKRSEMGSGNLKRKKTERCRGKRGTRERVSEEKDKENRDSNKVDRRIDRKPSEKVATDDEFQAANNILWATNKFNQNSQVSEEAVELLIPVNQKENCGGKQREGEKKENEVAAKKIETECNSENSSPVSVLDLVESIFYPKVPTSEEDARLAGPNSRRKLSAQLETNERSSPSCKPSRSSGDAQRRKMIDGRCNGLSKKDSQRQNYVEMWGEICRMAEGEMVESNWVYRDLCKYEDCEDIGAVCELQILEILLNELVDQLVEASP
ncbi:hypothetical protein U1Q18_020757 [Sarracenia purpurea var. burkii]